MANNNNNDNHNDNQSTLLHISGIPIYYFSPQASASNNKTNCVIMLHGRGQTAAEFILKFNSFIQRVSRNAHVVVFDQRNHGQRMLDPIQNQGITRNPNHAIDMYAIQLGTAQDVAFLIDTLPLYIPALASVSWSVLGYSLGGHAALLALPLNKLLTTCVAIVGCADYVALMKSRSVEIPTELFTLVQKHDPVCNVQALGHKKILLISADEDTLVPAAVNAAFVELLTREKSLQCDVALCKGGHAFSIEMQALVERFFDDH